jgi:hypothetical protein
VTSQGSQNVPPLRCLDNNRRYALIRRGVFHSIADLQAAINRYLKQHNDDPKPVIWTKPADAILTKLDRLPVSSV